MTLFDPTTGAPIPGNNLANANTGISPQALALLNYYPACNVNCSSTDPTVYNYQTISNAGSNNIAINTRYQRQLGQQTGGSPFGRFGGAGGGGRGQRQNANAPPVLRQNINAPTTTRTRPATCATSSCRSAAPLTAMAVR